MDLVSKTYELSQKEFMVLNNFIDSPRNYEYEIDRSRHPELKFIKIESGAMRIVHGHIDGFTVTVNFKYAGEKIFDTLMQTLSLE